MFFRLWPTKRGHPRGATFAPAREIAFAMRCSLGRKFRMHSTFSSKVSGWKDSTGSESSLLENEVKASKTRNAKSSGNPSILTLPNGIHGFAGSGGLLARSESRRDVALKGMYPVNQYHRVPRIILIRHGESLGNVDESAYVTTADWRIPLTEEGRKQARLAGQKLRNIFSQDAEEKVFFYASPYRRTQETLELAASQLVPHQILGVREEPRISEQQFGNFQNVAEVQRAKNERKSFGRFFYRFPNGEAGLDVYSRVTSFISTVFRDCAQFRADGVDLSKVNICIVTHGLTLRLFLMRWFQFSVEEFEATMNPANGSVIVLQRRENEQGLQWYEINRQLLERLNLPQFHKQRRFEMARKLREQCRLRGESDTFFKNDE